MNQGSSKTTEGYCEKIHDSAEIAVLEKALPRILFGEDKPQGVYGRSIYYPEKKKDTLVCHQYLIVWEEQKFPSHPMDYGPIFVYKIGGQFSIVIYDKGHYVADRLIIESGKNPSLAIANTWHSFVVREDSDDIEPQKVLPLKDQMIRKWWNLDNEKARLKIVNNLRDPIRMLGSYDFDDPPFSTVDRIFKKLTPMTPPMLMLTESEERIIEIVESEDGTIKKVALDYDRESMIKDVEGIDLRQFSAKAMRSLNVEQIQLIAELGEDED